MDKGMKNGFWLFKKNKKTKQKHHPSQWSEIVTSSTFIMQISSELINLNLLNFDPGCCRQLHTFISHAFLSFFFSFGPELDYHKHNPLFMTYFTPLILNRSHGGIMWRSGSGQSRNGRAAEKGFCFFFLFFLSLSWRKRFELMRLSPRTKKLHRSETRRVVKPAQRST